MVRKNSTILFVLMFMASAGYTQENKTTDTNRIKLLDFTLKNAHGEYVRLSDIKAKVIIVDFWDTWCPPCKIEIPSFISLYKKYHSKGVEIFGIALARKGEGAFREFVRTQGINYPCFISSKDIIRAFGGLRGIPTTFVLDGKGEIYKKYVGIRPIHVFEKDIEDILSKTIEEDAH